MGTQITNKELTEKVLQFFMDIPTISHALNKLRLIQQGTDEPIVNYNQRYQNLVERVEGCQLNDIKSTVAMELYLGSVIELIRKSIRNTLYFNSKHAPKTLGEAMLKAQDLHIKHLYAIGEEQQEPSITSSDGLPEITVNEVNTHENRGWYRNRCKTSEHSQNSHETPRVTANYNKKVMFDQGFGAKTVSNSEPSDSSQNSRPVNEVSSEQDKDKSSQPSVLHGSFTQIMVSPMQLQDYEFMAWLDRLVETKRKRKKDNIHTEHIVDPTMETSSRVRDGTNCNLETK